MKNYRNNKFKIVSFFYLMFVSVSCDKILDTDIPYSQISNEQVFSDTSSANAALAGLYAELWSSSIISGDASGSAAVLEAYTDDLTCYSTNIQNSIADIYNNVQIPDMIPREA